MRRLATNPVMLTAASVVHWNEKRLPEQRAELYESVLTWLARSREKRPGREPDQRCLELLGQLALAMQDAPRGRETQCGRRRAAEVLAAEFPGESEEKRVQRAESFIVQEELDSGIIVSRGSDLRFWHLTFQEYLAGRTLGGLRDAALYERILAQGKLYRPE